MVELFANSGDPDQTPRSAASDLGQHCLPVTRLGISSLHRKFGRFTKYSCILPGIHLSYPALCILLVIHPAFLYPTGHSCILLVDVMCCSVAELQRVCTTRRLQLHGKGRNRRIWLWRLHCTQPYPLSKQIHQTTNWWYVSQKNRRLHSQEIGFDISCKLSPVCMKCQILFSE